nr:unnamed protein product [Salmo salar]|eukprot:XP_014030734.1 PREDICTED: polyamine-modulated factor 1-binding protein 1-like isoform X2 [Salmo salar]
MELLAEQSGEAAGLRSELSCLQPRSSQLSEERGGWEERTRQLAAELHRLRTASRQSLDETRSCEGRLAELSAQLGRSQRWGQEQLVALEEGVVLIKVEMASLRENYHAKVAQVEVLHQSLGNARSDSSFLHRETELVVTNVNQWVKEQKQGNEKLNFKIKDQSKKIIHLTAEKDHLQESVEGLQEEMRLKAELEESRIEAERYLWPDFPSSCSTQTHRTDLSQTSYARSALTATGALSGPGDNLWMRKALAANLHLR